MSVFFLGISKFDIAIAACNRDLSIIPLDIYKNYSRCREKLLACITALESAKIPDLSRTIHMIPKKVVKAYQLSQEEIIDYVKEKNIVQLNLLTKYYVKATVIERYLSSNKLNIKGSKNSNEIHFKFLSSKTLRTTYKDSSFPVLNLKKEERKTIYPNNDYLMELDYNSADLRSLLVCAGENQPEIDIYQFILDKYSLQWTRDELKKNILVWIHAPEYFPNFEEVFDREKILNRYYSNNFIINPYGFKLSAEREKAFGYLAQSTTAVACLESIFRIIQYLVERKFQTRVLFGIHDSVVLDVKEGENIDSIVNLFERTQFGRFLSKKKIGLNYGEMR